MQTRNLLKASKLGELIFEQLYYGKNGAKKVFAAREKIVRYLIIFELVHSLIALLRYLRQCQKSARAIYFSETNDLVDQDEKEALEAKNFCEVFSADRFAQNRGKSVADLKKLIQADIDHLTRLRAQGAYNTNYEEVLTKTNKKIPFQSELPIPPQIMHQASITSDEALKIQIGEVIYIFRPLVYALLLKAFGMRSVKPLVASIFLDLARIVLQRHILFYRKSEKEEFETRNLKMALQYALRPPFAHKVLEKLVALVLTKVRNHTVSGLIVALLQFPLSLTLVI